MNQKKTILHITEVSSGGVLPIIVSLCNGLVDSYNVVFAYGVRPDTPSNLEEQFNPAVRLVKINSFTRSLSMKRDYMAGRKIKQIVKKLKPDIIHLHSTKAGLVGRINLLGYKCKKYYTPHGYCFLKQDDTRIKRSLYYVAEYILAKMGCITLACGRSEYEEAIRIDKKAIRLDNGIDTERIDKITEANKSIEYKEYTVYTAGRIGKQKNPKMFNAIAEKLPQYTFVWIGDGKERKDLISPNIMVTGFINRDKVIELAMNYHCYMSCSLWEGLPIALQEAMYMGKPCIVSDTIGNTDLITDNISGCICNNVQMFVDAIRSIINDKKKSLLYGKNAKEWIENNHTSRLMIQKYRGIIGA